jgi:transposase
MGNRLKMAIINSIQTLSEQGWSQRRIARSLGINRETVANHLKSLEKGDSNPAISTAGENRKPAISTAGRQSLCAAFTSVIEDKVEAGLEAQRIHQDLVAEHEFEGSYESVKRFVRKLRKRDPNRTCRIECNPGEEAQIDFGLGASIVDEKGRRRRSWVLRVILSFSRKGYSEAVFHQDAESFIRCLENAFRHFGGVPLILNPDNLKAAVIKADWYEPELNPKIESFCRHYGTTMIPSRPYHPQDKGKVESGVKYVKNNALKGRTFSSLQEQNLFLRQWESQVADQRIHGTVREQVAARFERLEKPALKPLPSGLFPCFSEGLRTVHRDGYVEVAKAYYQIPQEFKDRKVWVRWDTRCVRVFDKRMQKIITHTRLEPGKFSSCLACGGRKESVEKGLAYWQGRAARIGQPCGQWARLLAEKRGATAIRVLMGLVDLHRKHRGCDLDAACQAALSRDDWTLKGVKAQLERASSQTIIDFAQEHELIRSMSDYGEIAGNPFEE